MNEEMYFEGILTEEDVEKINSEKPVIICINNTVGQNPKVLRMLNNDILIRIVGWQWKKEISVPYADISYRNTTYSPKDLASVIEVFESMERDIDPKWSNLKKATFVYINLLYNLNNLHTSGMLSISKSETDIKGALLSILGESTNPSDLAIVFKEAMDRLGIPCKHITGKNSHSWNEIEIDGKYYPLDMLLDLKDNSQLLVEGAFELKHFLSDKEFYDDEIHDTVELSKEETSTVRALDHSEIQKALDEMLQDKRKNNAYLEDRIQEEIPVIKIRSKELKSFFKEDTISSDTKTKTAEIKEIEVHITDENISDLNEDLREIGQYYPSMLSSVVLTNDSGKRVDLQSTIDTIYGAQQATLTKKGYLDGSKIKIESDFAEDFDLDFSDAPEVKQDPNHQTQEGKKETTVVFSSKTGPVKLPNLKGKLSDNIVRLEFDNCDVTDFDISRSNVRRNGTDTGLRVVRLTGGGTSGVQDLQGLEDIVALEIDGITDTEFDGIMNLVITANPRMNRLYNLDITNQDLERREFLTEISNRNITYLSIDNSKLRSIRGLDALKNQLYRLALPRNELNIDDIREVSRFAEEKPELRFDLYGNSEVRNRINSLPPMSDTSYRYIDELLQKTGWYEFRGYAYDNGTTLDEKKRALADHLMLWDTKYIPYFIEDAQYFREELGYTCNPIMIKDVATLQNLLNDPNNYFEQNYLRDATLLLTLDQLEALINSGKTIPQRVNLKANVVSELDVTRLEDLRNRCATNNINLTGVRLLDDRIKTSANGGSYRNIDGFYNGFAEYSMEDFITIREGLEQVVSGIDPSLPEVDKFAIIYQRLSDLIPRYDDEATGVPLSRNEAVYQVEVNNSSKNLLGALLRTHGFNETSDSREAIPDYRAVCASYADVLKQALEMVGIEAVYDNGYALCHLDINTNTEEYEGGHAWTKVKIDGKWYYADLCWDRGEVTSDNELLEGRRYVNALRGERHFCEKKPYINNASGHYSHYPCCPVNLRDEHMEQDDYDQRALDDAFQRTANYPRGPRRRTPPPPPPPAYTIPITDDPDIRNVPDIDIDRIKDEYKSRKNDMYAKYYGDKEYQERYKTISERYRANEVEVSRNGITYRTIQDYAERLEDEKFLILGEYKEALERSTRYEAGDTGVYTGTDQEKQAKYERDKEYVETRNYTFDQNASTQKDLATLGKYGETLPYIQRQQGVAKNILRGLGNAAIFARNLVAPIYRFIGRTVAQPLHRLRTRGRDASPYKNNPYHRFVARRDFYNDVAMQRDLDQGDRVHSFRNMVMANIRAVVGYREGNEAVLRAGAYDIQENLKNQETQKILTRFLADKKRELESQIAALENEINLHPNADNIQEAQDRLTRKRDMLDYINLNITTVNQRGKIADIQTDAVSQTQHDIASKEFNTYKVTAIKGVAKLGAKKFVGPPLKKWLLARARKLVSHDVTFQEEVVTRKFIEGGTKKVPITEMQPDYDIGMDGLLEKSKGKMVKLFRSVSGGNKGEVAYTIKGDEICTGLHFQDGTTWGTGFSGKVPLMTDKWWPAEFLDASGNLRPNIKFSDIAKAITNGELSEDMLSKLTVQVAGKGWVYADELFEGVKKAVKVGEKTVKEAGHWENVVELVDKVKTVTEYVENPRMVNALNVLTHGANITMGVDTVHNAGEVLRPTTSDIRSNKKRQRAYGYDDSEFYENR